MEPGKVPDLVWNAPGRPMTATLVRCVALAPLIRTGSPDFLYPSGRANRYNPAGVACVYFSEDERTARSEYDRRGVGLREPLATYFAEVQLARVLDLSDPVTLEMLPLTRRDLTRSWYRVKKPTKAQLLGLAVSRQKSIAAIRYPSEAARAAGFSGWNVVIFRDCVRSPDFVRILGPGGGCLQTWG